MNDDPADRGAEPAGDPAGSRGDPIAVERLLADLHEVEETIDSAADRDAVREAKGLLARAGERGVIRSGVRRLDGSDVVEAIIGSVIFASPLLVEDGVFDIADHLFQATVAGFPVFLVANVLFVVGMTYALLIWTGRQKVETHKLLGVVPTRVVMVLVVSFLVAAILMTVWGRVGGWASVPEALSRVSVLWTVASIGAALGDILSFYDEEPFVEPDLPSARDGSMADLPAEDGEPSDAEILASLEQRFDDLRASAPGEETRDQLDRIEDRTRQAASRERFGETIRKYTTRDIAEAFVGSIVFSIPLLVEGGVFDVAAHFLLFTVGGFPLFFVLNAAFVVFVVAALLYWTGPQAVTISRPLLGFIPRRLVGIALVSFVTAAILMTMWGRVDGWQDPVVAVARVAVVWTVAAFGAALGDILPGESSGDDIGDGIAALIEGTDDG